jgi:hypothetical protein
MMWNGKQEEHRLKNHEKNRKDVYFNICREKIFYNVLEHIKLKIIPLKIFYERKNKTYTQLHVRYY